MRTFIQRAQHFLASEAGPTTVEYAVLLALIAAVVLSLISVFGQAVNTVMQGVVDTLDAEGAGGS